MAHYKFRNVNDAFRALVKDIHEGVLPIEVQPSRYGEVVRVTEPVIVTYSHPWECVLLNRARDANPFFAMYEALWMLAGRNDVAPLVYYNRRMREFSDDGVTLNDAYGYRWRHSNKTGRVENCQGVDFIDDLDQLDLIVNHLTYYPQSRRAVLEMWNVEDDLLESGGVLPCPKCNYNPGNNFSCSCCLGRGKPPLKSVCCNVCVFFEVESGICKWCSGTGYISNQGEYEKCSTCNGEPHDVPRYLNMTVINRSNDLVWGMLGANAVQFPFLQAYMAGRLGLEVGVYHQVTNNLHAYTKNWKPLEWLAEPEEEYPGVGMSLIRDANVFEEELRLVVGEYSGNETEEVCHNYKEPFIDEVVMPMCLAFYWHKKAEDEQALECVSAVESPDWREAGRRWLERRIAKRSKV